MKNVLYLVLFAVLLLSCSGEKVAGTISDTDTGRSAMVYNADLTPAVGAVVKFFEINDTEPSFETKTNDKGQYAFAGLAKGTYNVIANNDSSISFQDSVFISPSENSLMPDTLGKSGTVTGVVRLQPNHDPRTVVVQVLGTNVNSNVDSSGRFILRPLAKGEYNLRLETILPDYQALYNTIKTQGGKIDTLHDTLILPYTGIPVVTGLNVTYDTLNGVVHLSWNKTFYRDFQDYLIFRDDFDSTNLTKLPVAARGDTVFTDTIFKRRLNSGAFSFEDTNDYHFKYRVAVRSNVTAIGQTYKFIDVTAISPAKVKTTISFGTYHVVKGFKTDSASVNDSLLYTVKFNNPNRRLTKITWTDLNKGTVIYTRALDSTKTLGSDTIKYFWSELGEKKIECKIFDAGGAEWRDTCMIMVVKDTPEITISTPNDSVYAGDTFSLNFGCFDKFGKIVKWELSSGNSGVFHTISGIDTAVIAPNTANDTFVFIVRGTDDDGGISYDTLSPNIKLFRLVTTSASFIPRESHTAIVFNNKMWLIGGWTGYTSMRQYLNDVWCSTDGISWALATANAGFSSRCFHTSIVYDNKIWVIGGLDSSDNRLNDIWYSSDGTTWIQATSSAGFSPREGHTSVVFDNKMWVIGGNDAISGLKNDVWNSTDGITWSIATANAAFSPCAYHSTVVFDNRMWVIGGCHSSENSGVWYSSDGVTWVQALENVILGKTIVFDNKSWAIGAGCGQLTNDVLLSKNGTDWKQLSGKNNLPGKAAHTVVSFLDKIWVIGGNAGMTGFNTNDVWYYNPFP
jgi:hypothetical protein